MFVLCVGPCLQAPCSIPPDSYWFDKPWFITERNLLLCNIIHLPLGVRNQREFQSPPWPSAVNEDEDHEVDSLIVHLRSEQDVQSHLLQGWNCKSFTEVHLNNVANMVLELQPNARMEPSRSIFHTYQA